MLMHGCKEGQCASCKSFVLDGDEIELDKYSTFALPDYELEEGYTLLCRAHAYEDLTIELLNYDEEMIRSGLPIQQAVTEVVSKDAVTHDMRHLVLRLIEPTEIKFFPGQYMDIADPGHRRGAFLLDGQHLQPRERAAGVRHQGLPGRAVLQVPRGENGRGRPAGDNRAVRRLHPPRGRQRPGVRRRRRGHGAHLVAAADDGRARSAAQGHLLLRRPDQEGSLLRARAAQAGAEDTGLPLHTGPVRAGRTTRNGTARPA